MNSPLVNSAQPSVSQSVVSEQKSAGDSRYVIEKNVPIPAPKGRVGSLQSMLRAMAKGDSIFVSGRKAGGNFGNLQLLKPKKFVSRSVEGGCRIWRVS